MPDLRLQPVHRWPSTNGKPGRPIGRRCRFQTRYARRQGRVSVSTRHGRPTPRPLRCRFDALVPQVPDEIRARLRSAAASRPDPTPDAARNDESSRDDHLTRSADRHFDNATVRSMMTNSSLRILGAGREEVGGTVGTLVKVNVTCTISSHWTSAIAYSTCSTDWLASMRTSPCRGRLGVDAECHVAARVGPPHRARQPAAAAIHPTPHRPGNSTCRPGAKRRCASA